MEEGQNENKNERREEWKGRGVKEPQKYYFIDGIRSVASMIMTI